MIPVNLQNRSLSLWKKIIFSILIFILCLIFLEFIARIILTPENALLHDRHENIIKVLGLSDLNKTMTFDRDLFWVLKQNLNDFHVQGQIGSNINFTLTTRNGLTS